MSLGWLTESSLMPKRAKEIEHVSKASMVDLRAQLYRSEETLKQSDGTAAAAAEQERRRRERRTDVLGAGRNRGVESRAGTDDAHEAGMAQRAEESMQRKVEAYEAMARGDCAESSNSLVDFEMKQLRAPPPRNAPGPPGPPGPPSLLSADMAREAERVRWEEEAGAQTRRPEGSLSAGLQRYEQRSSMLEKRLLSEMAEETETGRATASEQKHKRQRALEERRAMLRLRQESRRRADEEQKAAAAAAADGPPQPPPLPPLPPPLPPLPAHDSAAAAVSTSTAAAGAWLEPCSPPNRKITGTPTVAPFDLPAAAAPASTAASDATMMQAMGLPAGFTSGFHEEAEQQARQEAEEAEHDARVSDAWQRYNPYGRR